LFSGRGSVKIDSKDKEEAGKWGCADGESIELAEIVYIASLKAEQ
jgi:hypothetical protein